MSKLNPALKAFWRKKYRNRILYGGRASSKSTDAAGWAIYLSTRAKLRICCARQFQSKIAESVYTLLKETIYKWELQADFNITNNSIINKHTGSEFLFYGLWRNIDEVKSLEGIDILWIEEAHNLREDQWQILEPTIRKQGSEIWIIFNPNLITDFVYKRFIINTPPNSIKQKINYLNNPFLSQTMLDIIEACKAEDEEDYQHIYLGEPLTDDDKAVIKRSHVLAAVDAHIKLGINPSGRRTIGFDVADAGEDYCATVQAHGVLAEKLDVWKAKEHELPTSARRVWTQARDSNAMIRYDAIGVGAGCGGNFIDLNKANGLRIQFEPFFAGGAVARPDAIYKFTNTKNRDYFSNIKSQAWWNLADRFANTYNAVTKGQVFAEHDMIFISSEMENLSQLIDELCVPKRDFDLAGRVKVESKKDLDKRGIASPNCADAFVLAFSESTQGGIF